MPTVTSMNQLLTHSNAPPSTAEDRKIVTTLDRYMRFKQTDTRITPKP